MGESAQIPWDRIREVPEERLAVREDETLALDRLRMKLSDTHAKLAIQRSPKGGGQITLKYQDLTDLESILNKLGLH